MRFLSIAAALTTIITSIVGLYPGLRAHLHLPPPAQTTVDVANVDDSDISFPTAPDVLPVQGRLEPGGYRTSIQIDDALTP